MSFSEKAQSDDSVDDEWSRVPVPQIVTLPELPHNIPAEHGLLGAILTNNIAYNLVSSFITPEHFYDDLHQRIYSVIDRIIKGGGSANPVTIMGFFNGKERAYIARLASCVVTVLNAHDYGIIIHDNWVRRQLMKKAIDLAISAGSCSTVDETGITLIDRAVHDLSSIDVGSRATPAVTMGEAAATAMEAAQRSKEHGGKDPAAIFSGLSDLDWRIGGFMPGDLVVIAGRPGMGKSTLVDTIARHVAQAGHEVLLHALEMSARQIGARYLALRAGVATDRQRRGEFTDLEMLTMGEACADASRLPITIDGTSGATASYIAGRVRHARLRRRPVRMVVVDHIGHMRAPGTERHGDTAAITAITRELKALALAEQVVVVAVSQLNRGVEAREDKRPGMADLRQSGSIEQDADVILLMYRDGYYVSGEEPRRRDGESAEKLADRVSAWERRCAETRHILEVNVVKQRQGNTGVVKVFCDLARMLIADLAWKSR